MGQDLVYACTKEQMLLNWNNKDTRHSTNIANVTDNSTIATEDGTTVCTIVLEPQQNLAVPGSDIRRMFNFT